MFWLGWSLDMMAGSSSWDLFFFEGDDFNFSFFLSFVLGDGLDVCFI